MTRPGRLPTLCWGIVCAAVLATGCDTANEGAQLTRAQDPPAVRPADRTGAAAAANAPSKRARARATSRRAGDVHDITFDDLEFPIERDGHFELSMLTESVRLLDGKSVILRGFILASTVFQQTGITQFVLVRDNQECCFGPGAYLYHNAQVELVPPRTTDFSIRPVTVHGTLSFRPYTMGGKTYSVFYIRAERVEH